MADYQPFTWEFYGLQSHLGENFYGPDLAKYYDVCVQQWRNRFFLEPSKFSNVLLIHNDMPDLYEISCPCDGDGNHYECKGMAEKHVYDNMCQHVRPTHPPQPIVDAYHIDAHIPPNGLCNDT